ncbi:uncharacterized protein SCHCODRAFT_01299153 [Schizophyllum commune H4-8]|nr:uncharacterized protein SCHCODRAFT_01299153 [Schizophyllum commune H4-8]KAI5892109.1 hypothetical protein SCHCODRAFT_01299153 [Schizophyllum commune H4-8]
MARIDDLPTEILIEILLAALPTYWFRSRPFSERLHISQVCSRWRAICLQTPRIWRRISYTQYRSEDGWRDEDVAALREYLQRSAGATLSVTMGNYRVSGYVDALRGGLPCISDLWSVVFAESRRWRVARFVLDEGVPIPVPYDEPIDIPELEEAGVVCPVDPDLAYPIEFYDLAFRWFANAPKLRRLSIGEPFFASVVEVVWERLTHLNLGLSSESLQEYVTEILPRCTALEHLEISNVYVDWEEGIPVVEIPTLRALVLHDEAVFLCRYLHVPRLERLAVNVDHHGPQKNHRDAFLMLAQRHPLGELRYLYINAQLRIWSNVDAMLEHTPGLTYLHIADSSRWRPPPELPKICAIGRLRALRTLSLQLDVSGWNSSAAATQLAAELARLPELEKFEMWNKRDDPDHDTAFDEQWLKGLRERGVAVEKRSWYPHLPGDSGVWESD